MARSLKADRVKACELAAQVMHGHGMDEANIGGRVMALAVFFESYISEGCSTTERDMQLLRNALPKRPRKLRAVGR
jgi:hypothetical protein